MKRLCTLIIFLTSVLLSALIEETGSFKGFIYGTDDNLTYDNYASHVAEGVASSNYNLYAPYDPQTNGFGDYYTPTTEELATWQNIVDLFMNEEFDQVEMELVNSGFPYNIILFHDTDTGQDYYILREMLNSDVDTNGTVSIQDDEIGSFDYGWGLYVYNPNGEYPVIVTIPHPNDDFITPTFGEICFTEMSARYLLIMGAGREVKWTNVPPYYNSKSLSDPSRVYTHPFNSFYRSACDEIREDFGKREFSLQIHSYDWNRHVGFPSLQISAGNGRTYPDLPIRDLSTRKFDMINRLNEVIIPENTIGVHEAVTVENLLGVYYPGENFTYILDGEEVPVPNTIDLPGYSSNRQMQKTLSGWNNYDRFEPFFHIEMDELPEVYSHTENNLNWFYGYDAVEESFDYSKIYKRAIQFYAPWANALNEAVREYYDYETNSIPDAPSNLQILGNDFDTVTLQWDQANDYNFETYEVLVSSTPIADENYEVKDRNDYSVLASQFTNTVTIENLNQDVYYFAIRAVDAQNNVSNLSNEIFTVTGCAKIEDFEAYAYDGEVELSWLAVGQENCLGFVIERKEANGEYETVASYVANNALAGSDLENIYYTYQDETVQNDTPYTYRLKAVNEDLEETIHFKHIEVKPEKIYNLYFHNRETGFADTISFGKNLQATNGFDNHYEVLADGHTGLSIAAHFYEQPWNTAQEDVEQHIVADFDTNTAYYRFVAKIYTNSVGDEIEFGLVNPDRNSEKLYLVLSNEEYNINETNIITLSSSTNTAYLYYGNIEPTFTINAPFNQLYQVGDEFPMGISLNFNNMIDFYDVLFTNGETEWNILSNITPISGAHPVELTEAYGSDLQVKVVAYLKNGDTVSYFSDEKFGVFPENVQWNLLSGRALAAVPFIMTDPLPEILEDYTLFKWNSFQFMETETMTVEYPYWFEGFQDFYTSRNYPIQKIEKEYDLPDSGWNLVPNPHLCVYDVRQLRFEYNLNEYSFNEAVQYNLISSDVYIYDDGYEKTVEIQPYQSFLIRTLEYSLKVKFIPYNNADVALDNPTWINMNIAANQGNDYDSASINFTDSLSAFVPKVPEKPFEEQVHLSFLNEETECQEVAMPMLSNDSAETRIIPLSVEGNFDLPFYFSTRLENYPSDLMLRMNIDGNIIPLDLNGETEIYFETEPTSVSLLIHNSYVNNEAPEQNSYRLKSYPNPFNITKNSRNINVQIAFNIPQKGNVQLDVYNLRGQHVKTIADKSYDAGEHVLTWNGKSNSDRLVSSGIYFYKLKHAKKTIVRKMMMLR